MFDLKAFRKEVGISQNDLGVLLKCGQPNISSMEKTNRDLDSNQEMILKNQFGNDIVERFKAKTENNESSDYVPLLPIEAMAGSLQGFSEGMELANCRKIKSPVKGAEFAIQISGDSMEPDYRNGSYLFIKKLTGGMMMWGHTMVVDTLDGVVFKKIFNIEGNNDYIEARSINPIYPPLTIEKSIILGFYRVLGGLYVNSTI